MHTRGHCECQSDCFRKGQVHAILRAFVVAVSAGSLEPNAIPDDLRNSEGELPPANIQTKSLGSWRTCPATSIITLPIRNSIGMELKSTSMLPFAICSATRFALRSLSRLNSPRRYDKVTLLPC